MTLLTLLAKLYHPLRVYRVFRVFLTVFLLIRKRSDWMGIPLLTVAIE